MEEEIAKKSRLDYNHTENTTTIRCIADGERPVPPSLMGMMGVKGTMLPRGWRGALHGAAIMQKTDQKMQARVRHS